MDIIRRWVRNFFGFSGREVNGFLVLVPLLFIIISSQPVYRWYLSTREVDLSNDTKLLDSLVALLEAREVEQVAQIDSLFEFNPNTCSVEDFTKLGISNTLSTRLASYRRKGGTFRIKADMLKIYGMDSSLYRRLSPYITLPEKWISTHEKQQPKQSTQSSKIQFTRFDINSADTTQLKSVYGIGTKLAGRIVKFRDGLGGFVQMGQLKEVFGLDSATVDRLIKKSYIKEDFTPRKININTANEPELSAHPYIRKSLAKAIVGWRFQHGSFVTINDLEKLAQVTKDDIRKISPYLKLND